MESTKETHRRRRRGLLALLMAGTALISATGATMSLALFTDSASADANTFTTGTIHIGINPAATILNPPPNDAGRHRQRVRRRDQHRNRADALRRFRLRHEHGRQGPGLADHGSPILPSLTRPAARPAPTSRVCSCSPAWSRTSKAT